jgi:hypothetical protein
LATTGKLVKTNGERDNDLYFFYSREEFFILVARK